MRTSAMHGSKSPPRRPHPGRVAAAIACLVAAGCRAGAITDTVAFLPAPDAVGADGRAAAGPPTGKPAPKTVSLEVTFARAEVSDAAWQDDLWKLTDEQILPLEVRTRLAANGLRAGLLSGPPPADIAARLEPVAPPDDPEALPAADAERPAVVRRLLNLLPGRDNEVVATTRPGDLILFEHDGADVHGGTYRDATAYFALKAWPAADGRVRIELVPTIKHGPLERSWIGDEGAFRLETGQRREPLDRLAIAAAIPPGGTLFVGGVGETASAAGDAFFTERADARPTRRVLAIRVRGRSCDPAFAEPACDDAAERGSAAAGAPPLRSPAS